MFGQEVAFSMRTFRFTSGSIMTEQKQTIDCNLHLEPLTEISEEQAPGCTCFNEEQCQGKQILCYILHTYYM